MENNSGYTLKEWMEKFAESTYSNFSEVNKRIDELNKTVISLQLSMREEKTKLKLYALAIAFFASIVGGVLVNYLS
jgi:hypothetical protein